MVLVQTLFQVFGYKITNYKRINTKTKMRKILMCFYSSDHCRSLLVPELMELISPQK